MLFMPNLDVLLRSPYIFLIFGVIVLCWGVISTGIGETLAPYAGRVIYRDEEPSQFWETVIMEYLIGVFFIGCFLYNFNPYMRWKEEVMLNDGKIIVVEQKRAKDWRETTLTINLPEISSRPIMWHEYLYPIIVNTSGGKLYVVGYPPTARERSHYGDQNYIGFEWKNDAFIRIPFVDIPEEIYTTNMLLENFPPNNSNFLNAQMKEQFRHEFLYVPRMLRLDQNLGCNC